MRAAIQSLTSALLVVISALIGLGTAFMLIIFVCLAILFQALSKVAAKIPS